VKIPLADQVTAIRAALDGQIRTDELTAAVRTMEWLAANPEAVKLAHAVVSDPAVKAIRAEFPGAKLVEIKT
jgi:hypothetical protein